ncbi:hypothetical protein SAMN05421810_102302 [Amycolatopsis arida]|uniref:Lipoprotein LprG n=1 Tax=Amycolatopsis arida TaxID=587909 RepID=A0A1I5PI73_9PSEU|nr:hypothetical protein [Amycolatopsis arida]TDX98510.1 hypothetical protein CLV69_101302 [Amycolatopsis arida]SFP33753.1 hypothetical protein SAMN05421810_102302 [Amycolatopsis arida]
MRSRPRLAGALVTAAAVLALTACGSEPTPSAPPASPSPTSETPKPLTDFAELNRLTHERFMNSGTGRLAMTLDAPGMRGTTMNGVYRVDGDELSFDMEMVVQGSDLRFVTLPGESYLRLPEGQAPDPSTPWMKVDPDSTDEDMRDMAEMLAGMREQVAELDTAFGDAGRITGSEVTELDGRPAVRYDFVVDLATYAASAPKSEKETMEELVKDGATELRGTMWTTPDHLPLQLETEGVGGSSSMKSSEKHTGHGEPVTIEAPPADQLMAS